MRTPYKVGETYATRNYCSVVIIATDLDADRPIVGKIRSPNGGEMINTWTSDGLCVPGEQREWDLMPLALPTLPIRKVWVNIYTDGAIMHHSKAASEKSEERIAYFELDIQGNTLIAYKCESVSR